MILDNLTDRDKEAFIVHLVEMDDGAIAPRWNQAFNHRKTVLRIGAILNRPPKV